MIIVLVLLLVKPIKSSLLSRVKNRYEYLPHDDADSGSEELYEFVSTNDFLPEPKNIVPKLYELNPNSYKQRKTTMYEIPYSFDKIRKTMESDEVFEEARQTIHDKMTLNRRKTMEHTFVENQNITDKLNILNKHIYDVQTYVSLNNNYSTEIYLKVGSNSTVIPISLEWRPTKNMSTDTTIKRRKTFASLFPTRRNLDTITETTTSRRRKTKYPEWLTWITNASDMTPTSFFDTLKSSVPSQSPLTSVSTFEMTQSAAKGSQKLKSKVHSCYMCGVLKSGIPRNQECYQVFDSPDLRYRYKKKRFRVKCVQNSVTYWSGRNFYGPFFRGGCFKRFLDIGTIYNERGCRVNSKLSKRGTYASSRFRKLEKLLNKIDDGCVSSPHASLTPFSRAISLYARYHVCVCKKRYCNASTMFSSNVLLYSLVLLKF